MHIDARELDDHTTIRGDVCIIGAGAAGISMALDWIDTPFDVVLLEGGGFEFDAAMQKLYDGETTGQRYYPLQACRLHYFGGTTGHWAGMCAPFDPLDFEVRDWVPHSGWPLTLDDLLPFYQRAQGKLELGDHPYDLAYWTTQLPDLHPLPLDEAVVWNKMWQFSPPSRFNPRFRDTITRARNIHLYTYANVVDLTANEAVDAITSVTVKNHAGKTHTVEARYFILAGGAIQNARLLLASNRQAPQGLGNDHDQVGRYFMEHLEVTSAELWLTQPRPMQLYAWAYGETVARAELALTAQVQREYQILNGTASLIPLKEGRHRQPRIDMWQNEDARESGALMRQNFGEAIEKGALNEDERVEHAFQLDTRIEQAPNPNSRVTLDTEKDALGVPRARLHWELTPLDKRSIRTLYTVLGQQVGLADVGRIRLHEWLQDETDLTFPEHTNAGWHHMGTTRMSSDPAQGVVDANCKVHGLANLFVAGSGCFATSGAPNPTLTLVALSLRTSDHVRTLLTR